MQQHGKFQYHAYFKRRLKIVPAQLHGQSSSDRVTTLEKRAELERRTGKTIIDILNEPGRAHMTLCMRDPQVLRRQNRKFETRAELKC